MQGRIITFGLVLASLLGASIPFMSTATARDLRWISQSSHLMVDRRWALDLHSGHFARLPFETMQPDESGGMQALALSVSRNGERVVVWDGQRFWFGSLNSALDGPVPLPAPSSRQEFAYSNRSVFYWSGRDELLLLQSNDLEIAPAACRLFHTSAQRWETIAHCPSGDFSQITAIEPGPQGLIAILSSAEGVAGTLIARFDPRRGQTDLDPFPSVLFPTGPVTVAFSSTGQHVHVITPCRLSAKRPCSTMRDAGPWYLYTSDLSSKRLILRHRNIPPHSVISPQGNRIAWAEQQGVCVSQLPSLDRRECYLLPQE